MTRTARLWFGRRASPILRGLGAPAAVLVVTAARLSARRRGVVVVYHGVGDPQGDWTRELVPVLGTRLFESQLRHLRASYSVVPASQIHDATRRRRRGERYPVAITFDDDLLSHEREAAPVLSRLQIPATFFLNGASLERPSTFWWQRLQKASDLGCPIEELVQEATETPHGEAARKSIHSIAKTIEKMPPERRAAVADRLKAWVGNHGSETGLSRDAVAALARAEQEIGFHTLAHDRLTSLDDAALAAAVRNGRQELAAVADAQIDLIAYPHGAADARVARAAESAGYRFGFTTEPEPTKPATDARLIGRVGPSYASTGHFAVKLALTLLG